MKSVSVVQETNISVVVLRGLDKPIIYFVYTVLLYMSINHGAIIATCYLSTLYDTISYILP